MWYMQTYYVKVPAASKNYQNMKMETVRQLNIACHAVVTDDHSIKYVNNIQNMPDQKQELSYLLQSSKEWHNSEFHASRDVIHMYSQSLTLWKES